jgi:hypothetical protein
MNSQSRRLAFWSPKSDERAYDSVSGGPGVIDQIDQHGWRRPQPA